MGGFSDTIDTMIEFTEGQRKTVATGLTVLSLTLVVAFAAFTAWLVLKLLSFAAPAIVPVVLGFFLALFFKPYYGWWTKTLRNPHIVFSPHAPSCWRRVVSVSAIRGKGREYFSMNF